MNDPYETTETHLERLLGRALNSFDLPDDVMERLDSALAHDSSLHSSHHSAALHRSTYRHAYLLADGSSLTLWELVHNTGRDGARRHELYADEAEARLTASRLRPARAVRPDGGDGARHADGAGRMEGPGRTDGEPVGGFAAVFGAAPEDTCFGSPDGVPYDDLDADLELLGQLLAPPSASPSRSYVPEESADHARRLLRRAENPDRPGETTAGLLRSAFAHHIGQAFGRRCPVDARDAAFTLYEHAFLLFDGTELSLWEVEHTATPDGRHMCEVYEDERTAREAMELRARVR
ncbi:hypothetical protein DDQ41_12060 [Streptomyces spongiicola]|uniref:Uncharacterized protein n=2 Tax=Streptomyces spongiicola TaxID=1690221 RepID=A0ABN5KJE7_9ACTN|nr:DUF6227 family protein [Streptomyces spongiicola]AWK09530.1 hypothetical protein DDQ41_12060 [Streptomyces spongiicola]